MSGFSHNHEDQYSSDVPSQHHYSIVHTSSSLQGDDTNIECFQGIPFHFGSIKVNATSSIDAIEVPYSSGPVCGLNKSNDDDQNADTEMAAQMRKRRKKNNSKGASRKNDEKKMKGDSKMEKEGQSPGTPERGYVHVRARRGQATDSHSLAERVRRERIGERMKLLQSLVPGCDKIAGKAQVLDEIINYVQSLQTQIQILVGKLSIPSPYASGYENNLEGIVAPPATTTASMCSLEASLSCMMGSSCNLLNFADDSQHNSLVSVSSPSSFTSQGDQEYFISQGTEFPLWENGVQGYIGAFDQYWLDHLAQLQ